MSTGTAREPPELRLTRGIKQGKRPGFQMKQFAVIIDPKAITINPARDGAAGCG